MTRTVSILLILLAAAFLGLVPEAPVHVGTESRYVLQTGSEFWIEGRTTVSGFTCTTEQAAGVAVLDRSSDPAGAPDFDAVIAVPVRSFDCGLRRMNRDLYEALRGEEYPAIRFALNGAAVDGTVAEGWTHVEAWGTLALAGAERPVRLRAEGQRLPDGRVRLRGAHTLQMTDFGVDPPSDPLGLVRARDRITVHFDIHAAPAR